MPHIIQIKSIRKPQVIPAGWMDYADQAIWKNTATGLLALFSLDFMETEELGLGTYRHMSLSRKDRYPEWDEMRDFIYSCGLFDKTKDVIMFLPPKEEYVNMCVNCFHFYQKDK